MTFNDLNLSPSLNKAIIDIGITKPTIIQQKAFSPIMSGKDVLGIAQTGTGKTFAYLLPLLNLLKVQKKKSIELVILVPTRELVMQVVEEIEKLTKYTYIKTAAAYGGANIKTQILAIVDGVEIIVATPGRFMDLLLNKSIHAKLIKKLVLDEADEMLNLGFRTQLNNIFDLLPIKRQTIMFSATITEEVDTMINHIFNNPIRIEAATSGTPLSNINQMGYYVPNFNTKINLLKHLLSEDNSMAKVLVFANSKKMAEAIHEKLAPKFEEQLAVIHANKTQNTRFKTVAQFENGSCRILIASDLIARGLDVTEVTHVINMDVPKMAENYMHRIGRTGRADKKGIAITFVSELDMENKNKVEELMNYKISMVAVPTDVVISTTLTMAEIPPDPGMKMIHLKQKKSVAKGASHHEKKDKNKKVNVKETRADKKKKKYGKSYKKEFRS